MALIFNLLGSLGIFLFGMKVMSDGIHKVAGDKMKAILGYMTKNRFMAVFTGFLITALIQSSSATTVMVVSFVNAGLLTLVQSIGVIMGANIGTTITTWIVSFLGFKFTIQAIALPIIGIGLPFFFSKKKIRREWAEVLIGFGLLFLGLGLLKDSVPDINSHPEILQFVQDFTGRGLLSYVIFVALGAVLTIAVQSSSAAMAITVTMAYKGWIDFPTASMIVLGENVGTTITAYLASIGTSVNARRAARAHLLFNLFGVFWMTLIFRQFIQFINFLSPWENIFANLPLKLSLFHTVFNVINTFICVWLVKYFALAVEKIVKPDKSDINKEYKLIYMQSGRVNATAFNLEQARAEIFKLVRICEDMFETSLHLFFNPHKKLGDEVEKIRRQEMLTDEMQREITNFLTICSGRARSDTYAKNINAMIRISHELEGIGDSVFRIMVITKKKYDRKLHMHPEAYQEIQDIANAVKAFMNLYNAKMLEHMKTDDLKQAYEIENQIYNIRKKYTHNARERIASGNADVPAELLYLDLLRHFEHIGEYSLNIAQALRSVKK
ncbi:MAG: Na/Pi cotransporter family protein [Candidatus Cloacimonadales bacterium]